MKGRPAAETDATKGSCARALAQRAVGVVDTRTRRGDPFASRSGVGITLAYTRSRDPNTTPSTAIDHACSLNELVVLPRPRSGESCLTVRDARRIAACLARYREACETQNAGACLKLLEEGLPTVLEKEYVRGP
ncbi:hypothetical protein HRTV-28_gp70 [Halorubrum tailed virus 28]|uniref:Uncharacterized protein n=1 Tax=Halorubrum tailed virus 28 TaxID=2878009 RepID=A0AAE9BZH0_9CAUD|nr:hypothetical protein M1M39_gp71 [Halorubrum tailed virus 28]UBF23508.1 hypothetical protein HRTV-28_gp70 [Halorubrum tailed virus 28]